MKREGKSSSIHTALGFFLDFIVIGLVSKALWTYDVYGSKLKLELILE